MIAMTRDDERRIFEKENFCWRRSMESANGKFGKGAVGREKLREESHIGTSVHRSEKKRHRRYRQRVDILLSEKPNPFPTG